jgi:hypothetical protein
MVQEGEVSQAKEVVLRNYIPKDTPENVYRTLQSYHYLIVGLFTFWTFVRVAAIAGKHFVNVSETAIAMMPVEIRSGAVGALICVILAAFNLTTAYGVFTKETWGWWLALIGMFWGIFQSFGDLAIETWISSGMLVSALHISIALGLCVLLGWLISIHSSAGMRVKFGVQVGRPLALGLGLTAGLILGLIFLVWAWATLPMTAAA